jgi:hypothetical protein
VRLHQDRHQVAAVLVPGPVALDEPGQQAIEAADGRAEAAVGPGRDPGQGRDVGHDAVGNQFGQQHPQQAFDLIDRLGFEVARQQGPDQHGQGDRAHLPVEGQLFAVRPGLDARHRHLLHRAQIAGDLGSVEGWLHEPPLAAVVLAVRHHQTVADQPLGPAEAEALVQLPGLSDQGLPDRARAVQQVDGHRPEPDPDHLAVLPGPLQQRQRVAPEFQGVPEDPAPARHQGDVRPGPPAHRGAAGSWISAWTARWSLPGTACTE